MTTHPVMLETSTIPKTAPKKTKSFTDLGPLLIKTEAGTPKALLANAIALFRHHQDLDGAVALDSFALRPIIRKNLPPPFPENVVGQEWTERFDSLGAEWCQRNGVLINSKVAAEAAQTVAHENAFHPVRDYLNALRWDGTPRIEKWLTVYLGVGQSPLFSAVGACFLISAIARIHVPGCQADSVLLAMGKQGIRKSTAFRTLAVKDRWFSDTLSELGSKDSRVELAGKWITEMSELDRIKGRALESVKSFLTTREDHYRPPYGRRAVGIPRQCVFVGTTNSESPLTDESGNRRFWTIMCGEIDTDALARDRDQLWAEALVRYQRGDKWYLGSKELQAAAIEEQAKRYEGGVWDETIVEWLDDPKQAERYESEAKTSFPIEPFDSEKGKVTVRDILLHCIKKPLHTHTQADRNTIARCLIHSGYSRKQVRGKGWFYEKANTL